ncbi:probable G-protein coupled receptor Mth-like 2 [Pecten maximus]|uniref:probable G-protein coupled receptor Mth-like 2 n=1 Tax=Pecten maximus TaxID=6579 RepID=UPI001458D53A|nr:probable G-protein coupled receptor Mth-like 2 [Pecten maximus]
MVPGFEPYKNVFCSLCSNINTTIMPPPQWNPRIASGRDVQPLPFPGIHLVRGMFSESHHEPFSVKSEIQILTFMNDEEIYNTVNNKTRRLTCYPGKVLTNKTCKPLLTKTTNLRYTMAFKLESNLTLPGRARDLLEPVMRQVKGEITQKIRGISFDSFHIMVNMKCDDIISSETGEVIFMVHTMFLIRNYVDRLSTEEALLNLSNRTFIFHHVAWKSSLSSEAFMLPALVNTVGFMSHCYSKTIEHTTFNLHNNYQPALVSPLLLCRQVELDQDEFEVEESTFEISLSKSTRKLHQDEFLLIDKKVRICLYNFQDMFNGSIAARFSEPPLYAPLKITTFVCNVISLVCLLITFITYCLFPTMRSLPGMNNMSLVFAMFFAQLLFQCGFYMTSSQTLCTVLGVFIHIFWLSTFGCMSACSYHMYSVFAGDIIAGRLSAWGWKRRMSFYILYSYGLSAAIVSTNIIIVYLTSEDNNIGYGKSRCFINNRTSFYLSFLAPVLIVCFTNIYFFIRTALQIKNSPKVDSTKERKNQHLIYIKLFSITGITWILLIIDTLLPITVFSFLVTIATVCQGLFVFVSFVLNKRVLNYYKVLLCGKKLKSTISSTSQPGNTQSTIANSGSI